MKAVRNRRRSAGRCAGFTLPELLAAALIGSLVMAGLFRFVLPVVQTMGKVDARLSIDNNAQVALSHLRTAVRGGGDWRCSDRQAVVGPTVGGGNSRPGAEALDWPEHLAGTPDRGSEGRLDGTDVLWVGRHGVSASTACKSPLARADIYFIARNIADRPALYRRQVWPEQGRRQEVVAGVISMQLRFAVRGDQSIRWRTGDALTREMPVEAVHIALALSAPAPGEGTHHRLQSSGPESQLTTGRPSVVRRHSTAVLLSGGGGNPV